MALWRADCFFLELVDGRETEKQYTIDYAAMNSQEVIDAVRWVRNRQRTIPKMFGPLLAIKVYRLDPRPIALGGAYYPPTWLPHYEWKCDSGVPVIANEVLEL